MVQAKNLISKIGIDGAVFFTVMSKVLQAGGGVISIVFIARYLSKVEQGYYYTFGSILAIQIFFELGFTGIITQYVAHEKALLTWKDEIYLIGDQKALSRMSSLLRFCLKWFGVLSVALFLGLLLAGYSFFENYGDGNSSVEWRMPWFIMSFYTAITLVMSPIFAFLEGLGKVKQIAQIRLIQQCVQLLIMFALLIFGAKLFASPISVLISLIVPIFLLFFRSEKKILKNLWVSIGEWKVDYRKEIFPFQWRIALSWISGYFMFQLFNPVIFATEGAKVAGQMGMTLSVLGGVLSVALSWVSTKVPLFSGLIAQKNYVTLDRVFYKTLIQASTVCLFCILIFIGGVYVLKYYNTPSGDRFLPLYLVILLALCTFTTQLINALATYLRCHKKEPFLVYSIVMGLLTAGSIFLFGHLYGIDGIVGGYAFLTVIVSFMWALYIFKTKKNNWHG
ncbi:polysaccharide biosynthesis protein [Chryseobacterium piscicola]|uniref:Polysaccharide biosynthesis protein n=1 Tax=Chryseobacterium piscicola TaxID=551459 RepID=A0A2S7KCE3_9FLAO|nr:polysaccharide biosynthesis protein [Chryseobacterium piscicola]